MWNTTEHSDAAFCKWTGIEGMQFSWNQVNLHVVRSLQQIIIFSAVVKLVSQFDELSTLRSFRRILHMKVEITNNITPVRIAYLRPKFTSKLTRRPAKTTPQKFAEIADQKGISKIEAMIAPVHAPVPGNGTATNSISPSHWNSSTGPAFAFAFSNIISRNWDADLFVPAKNFASGFKYSMMKGTGTMFLQCTAEISIN